MKKQSKTYRKYKLEIKEENFYDNRDSSNYLFQGIFQARTLTLHELITTVLLNGLNCRKQPYQIEEPTNQIHRH